MKGDRVFRWFINAKILRLLKVFMSLSAVAKSMEDKKSLAAIL